MREDPAAPISVAAIRTLLTSPVKVGAPGLGRKWTVFHGSDETLDIPAKPGSMLVLYARLTAASDRQVRMSTGSNGPIVVMLNGNLLLHRSESRFHTKDTDLIDLHLVRGENRLMLAFRNPKVHHIRASIRFMNTDFSPARIRFELPGDRATPVDIARLKGALRLSRTIDLSRRSVAVHAVLVFPGGVPEWTPGSPTMETASGLSTVLERRILGFEVGARPTIDLGQYHFDTDPLPDGMVVSLDRVRFRRRLGFRLIDVRRLGDAQQNLSASGPFGPADTTTFESLAWRIDHLRRLIQDGDEDFMYINKEVRNTLRMTKALRAGDNPYYDRRNQVQRRGYRSSLDGSLQPYALYIPPGRHEEDDRRFPLLVSLHGLGNGPMKAVQAVFGIPKVEGDTRLTQERYPKPVSVAPMFVLAPFGFGNSGYRTFGEKDVLDAMAQVTGRYRIDPDRIYITGTSMGGIGAASLPLHYPDLFAAAAPLGGYHSMFLFRRVLGRPLKPFERFLLQARSNTYFAVNGRTVPMYLVHGLKDRPAQSRVLATRYQELGYDVTYETPNLGHNVWDVTYQGRRIFQHFKNCKREAHPRHVSFDTPTLRYPSAYFIRVDAMVDYGRWARVDANWQPDDTILVRTENVSRITIFDDPKLRANGAPVIEIDGNRIVPSPGATDWNLLLQDNRWRLDANHSSGESHTPKESIVTKRTGLSGPIEDALFEPLLFVYGTLDAAEETLSKRLIDQLIHGRSGVTIDWPVKADRDVTEQDLIDRSIVVVGTPSGNSLLRRVNDRLPIRAVKNAIIVGRTAYRGQAPAAAFIYPNPLSPNRYLTVYTAASLEGLYFVGHLPETLPDYVVFDGPSMTYKHGRIFDTRPVLRAGFFDHSWRLPDFVTP